MAVSSKTSDVPYYTSAEGRPIADPTTSVVLRGTHNRLRGGLSLLEDTALIETLAHFPRERIPERVVHAKAAGAWGEFEVTHDISDITSCDFLTGIGKKTPVLARISTVAGEKGASDTLRDIRGFALKIFTEEGNQDFVFNDLPVFFIRDPIKFPSLNRSHKKHPQTNVPDATMFWDFHNNNQEGTHALMQVFGGRGVPKTLRHVSAFGVHTYKLGKPEDGTFKYVKWHFVPDLGHENLSEADAVRLAGEDPDYHVRDLFNSIAAGNFPSWTLNIQVMDPADAETVAYDIFDDTKTWPHADYPLQPVGKLTLNRNPDNYFQDIEQAAFSPSTMVPGIGPSADTMLQARMFSYPDAARYRVGPNYQQLPCNKARSVVYSPFQRDGPGRIDGNYGADPDYVRSSFRPVQKKFQNTDVSFNQWSGKVENYSSEVTDADFEQPRKLWDLFLKDKADDEFIHNVSGHLSGAIKPVQDRAIEVWGKVHEDIGRRIRKELDENPKKKDADPNHLWQPRSQGS
ncbi:catalase A [Elasticomyces elasticus]|nr:catalase A [Elasticomyces elasticus]